MKNVRVAINGAVKANQISLKSIYETLGQNGDSYYCKLGGDIYYCFVFVVRGKMLLKAKNDLKIPVEKNEAIFILSNEIKSYKCVEDDTLYVWTYFSYDGSSLPVNTPFELNDCEKALASFEECQTLLNNQNEFDLLCANKKFTEYFIEGVEKLHKKMVNKGTTNIAILNSIDFINENLFHLPIVEDIAKMHGMSIKKYREDFEKVTGVTPSKYIKEKKLMLAKNYLDSTHLTLAEIAELLEFSSSYYLSNCFKERFNITPKEYRAKRK